jgi:hypothetical protein
MKYKSNGELNLFAAFNTRTGEVIGQCHGHKRQFVAEWNAYAHTMNWSSESVAKIMADALLRKTACFCYLTYVIRIISLKLGESVLEKSYNVIPAKTGIQIVRFTYGIALKSFTSCPAFAGMTDICYKNGLA